jgi:hypothetical protein
VKISPLKASIKERAVAMKLGKMNLQKDLATAKKIDNSF